MVGVDGFEPSTFSLSEKRSNQLSYTPKCHLKPGYCRFILIKRQETKSYPSRVGFCFLITIK